MAFRSDNPKDYPIAQVENFFDYFRDITLDIVAKRYYHILEVSSNNILTRKRNENMDMFWHRDACMVPALDNYQEFIRSCAD